MTYERSCGAVVFRDAKDENGNAKRYVLMIKHTEHSRHSFPKGHMEPGESEVMTAQREVFEESMTVNVIIELSMNFLMINCSSF